MLAKIDFSRIVRDHIRTLSDQKTGKIRRLEVFVYLLVPILVAILALVSGFRIDDTIAGVLLTAAAILGGLLFNLLLLAHQMLEQSRRSEPEGDDTKKASRRLLLLEEIVANISFAILMVVLGIVALVAPVVTEVGWVRATATLLAVSFLLMFGPTLLIVLKRIHDLLDP